MTQTKTKDNDKYKDKNRLHSLDALRGIAALLVFLYHYLTMTPKPNIVLIFPHPFQRLGEIIVTDCGGLMVQLFFVLSGFIFYKIYKDRIQSRNISFRDFFCFDSAGCILSFGLLSLFKF